MVEKAVAAEITIRRSLKLCFAGTCSSIGASTLLKVSSGLDIFSSF
jgi:hypothetical protein